MTKEEYRERSNEILDRIADYDADNCACEAQIANNNRQMVLLERQHKRLMQEYRDSIESK